MLASVSTTLVAAGARNAFSAKIKMMMAGSFILALEDDGTLWEYKADKKSADSNVEISLTKIAGPGCVSSIWRSAFHGIGREWHGVYVRV
ncbi:hypothetical protein [Methanocella conradii]|uniref:hypothetical protein n=1 Tax=Methanocella conradii TaxID=1175444 RepID=UPI0024B387F8|nr:hypothetical protein [Methanocella conradii]MDI6897870.1 hypothetical protein [Methanocella conradii]